MTPEGGPEPPLPPPPQDVGPANRRRRPRNYLVAAEHRRLFWRLMPPAVVAIVTLDLLTRSPSRPPGEPQVDTLIARVAEPADEEGVVVLASDEPPVEADAAPLSASPRSLAKVRDATFFRQADEDAWFESFLTLRGYDGRSLPPPRDVGFTEIFGQPGSFRGRAVRMRGTLHRLERRRAPPNDYGIDAYWQGVLEPAGGPASPVLIHFLEVPEGMPAGLEIREPVVVSGCFLKNLAYQATDGVRLAPLLLARGPERQPVVAGDSGRSVWDLSLGVIGVVTMLGIVAAIAVGFALVGRGRRRAAAAAGLDATLAEVEPVSIAESLRRMAADEPAADGHGPMTGDDP